MHKPRSHVAFGLHVESDFDLLGVQPEATAGPDVTMRLAPARQVDAAFSGPRKPPARVGSILDGRGFVTERGAAGDLRFDYSGGGAAHWSPDSRLLICSAEDSKDPAWLRVILDSVLGTLALESGLEALHASAVGFPQGAVAIMAASGGGKTSLALELARRGHELFADDIVAIDRNGTSFRAHPSPPVANVPLGGAIAPEALGLVLATFDDEAWVAVRREPPQPSPLAATFILDREAGRDAAVLPIKPPSPLPLLQHGLRSGTSRARMTDRFHLLSDVAAQVPAFRLQADPAVSPAGLADLVEAALVTGAAGVIA